MIRFLLLFVLLETLACAAPVQQADQPMKCRTETPPGSRIARRVCGPVGSPEVGGTEQLGTVNQATHSDGAPTAPTGH